MDKLQVEVESMPPTTFDIQASIGSAKTVVSGVLTLIAQPVISSLYPNKIYIGLDSASQKVYVAGRNLLLQGST